MSFSRFKYLARSSLRTLCGQQGKCPSCGADAGDGVILDRKYLVTTLRRCTKCALLYRTPVTGAEESESFYQEEYDQGFTTEMPSPERLEELKKTAFAAEEKNYAGYVAVLRALGIGAGARVFDFGCSWGYGSWQLAQAGYDVSSFEISRPRAAYAREKLGVKVQEKPEGQFDVFFSAHVIEHVPSVTEMVRQGMDLLRPGGVFVCFTPNGSQAFREANPAAWSLMWGMAHPQLIDLAFLERQFAGRPLLVTSAPLHDLDRMHPLESIRSWDRSSAGATVLPLREVELLFVMPKT